MNTTIKNSLIKIAYENPELRAELLPLILKEGSLDKEAGILQKALKVLGTMAIAYSLATSSAKAVEKGPDVNRAAVGYIDDAMNAKSIDTPTSSLFSKAILYLQTGQDFGPDAKAVAEQAVKSASKLKEKDPKTFEEFKKKNVQVSVTEDAGGKNQAKTVHTVSRNS